MDFSAALFAGGRSSRMGRDKAFLEIKGVPLWQRQLQILRELGPAEIFLSGPRQIEWVESGLEIVVDARTDAGPLGGLVAVLRRSRNTRSLVLAVDLPNMTSEFLGQLLAMSSDQAGVVPNRKHQFEPLAAVYPARCLALAETCLNAGEYSLQQLTRRAINAGLMRTKEIAEAEQSLFFNLNTQADLAAIANR